jgi:serine phosphatase RsbU (regulator of sigma subunit)
MRTAGKPLGLASGWDAADTGRVRLEAGDTIVLASDGVLDAISSDRRRYLLEGIERAVLENDLAGAASLADKIVEDLSDYAAGVRGDRTLLVLRVVKDLE